MRLLRLAFITVAAGLLMAPGIGSVAVGDSGATIPIGDLPVGDRFSGCPTFATTPALHIAARFESYADNDPVPSITDQQGLADYSMGTGSMQPTFRLPCESGKLGDQSCMQGDGGDRLDSASVTATEQPNVICALFLPSTADDSTTVTWFDGPSGVNDHGFWTVGATGNLVTIRAGVNINSGTMVWSANEYITGCAHFNSASSEAWVNGASVLTGDAGAEQWAGGSIMGRFNASQYTNGGRFAEMAVFTTVADADAIVADFQSVMECVYGGGFPQAATVDEPLTVEVNTTPRYKRYAQALHKRGLRGAQVVNRLVARGLDEDTARILARRVYGRTGRIPESLHTVRVGLASRWADRDIAGRRVARALCKPLDDEDGDTDPDAVRCFNEERGYMAEQWCEVGQTTPVIAGARAWMTADEADRVQVEVDARPALRGIRNATDARHAQLMQNAAAAAGFGPVERCREAE